MHLQPISSFYVSLSIIHYILFHSIPIHFEGFGLLNMRISICNVQSVGCHSGCEIAIWPENSEANRERCGRWGINIARKTFVEPQSKSTDILLGYIKRSFRGISDCSVGSSHTWIIPIQECSTIALQSHSLGLF